MLSSKKTLLKNSFLYVVLGFLPLAANFFLAPVYSRFISPGEYGIIALASIFEGFLTVAITLGLDGAFSRIYFDYHKKEKLVKGLMSTTLLAMISSGAVLWVILHLFGDSIFHRFLQNKQFTYSKYGYLVFFSTFSSTINAIFLIYYRNKEAVLKYSLLSLTYFFTSAGCSLIGIIYFKAEALGNIAGRAVGTTLVSSTLLTFYFIKHGVNVKTKYLKNSLAYAIPLVPYSLLLMLYNNIDKIMIERYFELNTLGLYNFAFLLASGISVLIYAIFNAISPHIYKLLIGGKEEDISQIKKINSLFHLIMIGIITFAIAVIIPFLKIFISVKYQSVQDYISLLILVYIFQLYYVIYTVPLFFHKKTRVLPWISFIVLVIGIFSNITLIPLLGIYGVCLSLFATKLSQFSVALFFNKYYGYHKSKYLLFSKNHLISIMIIISFGLLYILNYSKRLYPAYIINLFPFLIFIFSTILFFRYDIASVKKIIQRATK